MQIEYPSECKYFNDFLVFYLMQVISNQEAVDTIKYIRDTQEAAVELIEEAVSRKSTDDISCIVVHLL